ncbi:hypothetical protein HED60_19305 [Planctomycetales bacterium ZRK34]|nr:hypothetical protein HED60_19305 [Planctomycetales bacterium ZRK34]
MRIDVSEITIGIDPGISGAIAVIAGGYTHIYDMPTLKKKVNGKERTVIDIPRLAYYLNQYRNSRPTVAIEKVSARPKQGVSSTFKFGEAYGIVEGLAHSLTDNVIDVTPRTWQAVMLKGEANNRKEIKTLSRQTAQRIAPDLGDMFKRVKDDGRADALLIAQYAKGNHQC